MKHFQILMFNYVFQKAQILYEPLRFTVESMIELAFGHLLKMIGERGLMNGFVVGAEGI